VDRGRLYVSFVNFAADCVGCTAERLEGIIASDKAKGAGGSAPFFSTRDEDAVLVHRFRHFYHGSWVPAVLKAHESAAGCIFSTPRQRVEKALHLCSAVPPRYQSQRERSTMQMI